MTLNDKAAAKTEEPSVQGLSFADAVTPQDSLLGGHSSRLSHHDAPTTTANGGGSPEGTLLCSNLDLDGNSRDRWALQVEGEPKTAAGRQRLNDMIGVLTDKNGIDQSKFYNLLDEHLKENGIKGVEFFVQQANRQMRGPDSLSLKVTHENLTKDELAEYRKLDLSPPSGRATLQIVDTVTHPWFGCPNSQFILFNRPVNQADLEILNAPGDTSQWFRGK